MKNMINLAKFLIITNCSLFFSCAIAQTVSFDFSTEKFYQSFPFDQHFTIEFKELESSMERIEFKIWNTTKMHRVQNQITECQQDRKCRSNKIAALCQKIPDNAMLSKELLLRHDLIPPPYYGLVTPYRDTKGNLKASTVVVSKLLPNESYIVEINTGAVRPITPSQKIEARDRIVTSTEYIRLVDDLFNQVVDKKRPDYGFITIDFGPRLVSDLEPLIKEINPNYRFSEFNPYKLDTSTVIVTHLANVYNRFRALQNVISDINKKITNSKDSISFDEMINQLQIKNREDNTTVKIALEKIDKIPDSLAQPRLKNNFKIDLENAVNSLHLAKELVVKTLVENILVLHIGEFLSINKTYESDVVKNAKNQIFENIGYGYADGITHFTYAAMALYLRPVNLTIPPKHYSGADWWLTRCSLILGASITGKIHADDRRGIINDDNSLVLGLGFRIAPGIAASTGGFFYYDIPTPVVSDNNYLKAKPFISLAIDLEVQTTFEKAFKETSNK